MSNFQSFNDAAYLDVATVFCEDDAEHDDFMTAEDYDTRRAQRDGWATDTWDGRW
jgi:predicted 3-demethylubiquinone-9 3-methyltransferase (glyoxalase superfamily)